jgi:hypothetical protein
MQGIELPLTKFSERAFDAGGGLATRSAGNKK